MSSSFLVVSFGITTTSTRLGSSSSFSPRGGERGIDKAKPSEEQAAFSLSLLNVVVVAVVEFQKRKRGESDGRDRLAAFFQNRIKNFKEKGENMCPHTAPISKAGKAAASAAGRLLRAFEAELAPVVEAISPGAMVRGVLVCFRCLLSPIFD